MDGAKNVVCECQKVRTLIWSAVAATSAAMECTGMFRSPEMVCGCVGMALVLA